jgi:hypothetical protein
VKFVLETNLGYTVDAKTKMQFSLYNIKFTTCHAGTSNYVRFEVFTAMTMKNAVFWDVTPCGSCKNRRFGGT